MNDLQRDAWDAAVLKAVDTDRPVQVPADVLTAADAILPGPDSGFGPAMVLMFAVGFGCGVTALGLYFLYGV